MFLRCHLPQTLCYVSQFFGACTACRDMPCASTRILLSQRCQLQTAARLLHGNRVQLTVSNAAFSCSHRQELTCQNAVRQDLACQCCRPPCHGDTPQSSAHSMAPADISQTQCVNLSLATGAWPRQWPFSQSNSGFSLSIGALIITLGFGGPLYYDCNKEYYPKPSSSHPRHVEDALTPSAAGEHGSRRGPVNGEMPAQVRSSAVAPGIRKCLLQNETPKSSSKYQSLFSDSQR